MSNRSLPENPNRQALRFIPTDFGDIPVHEEVPEDLIPDPQLDPALMSKLEDVRGAGGWFGIDYARLEKRSVLDETGRVLTTITYLMVPFSGYFLHKLKQEPDR